MPEYRVTVIDPSSYFVNYSWIYDGDTPAVGAIITVTTIVSGPGPQQVRVTRVDEDAKRITAEELSDD
jgi:hypothetical protein